MRKRRTNKELEECLQALKEYLKKVYPNKPTIRHCFYKLEMAGYYGKTQKEYQNLVSHITTWRKSGEIPFSAFSDNSRWYYGRRRNDSINEALEDTVRSYRRNLWKNQDTHVEIWCEKDAIAGILLQKADEFGVQVFPTRGFTSLTALYNASEQLKEMHDEGKEIYIYYFGDFDKSGQDIDISIQNNLENLFDASFINFERIAVTEEQIIDYDLPTRPEKNKNSLNEYAVDIDAMDIDVLQKLVEGVICRHLDMNMYEATLRIEQQEKILADQFMTAFNQLAG